MSRIVHSMSGFIDEKFYESPDGERVTVVRFENREAHRAWAEQPDHVSAQRRGRAEFYSWYDISVCEETYQNRFDRGSSDGDVESDRRSERLPRTGR